MTKLEEMLTDLRTELRNTKDIIKYKVEFTPDEIIIESHELYKPNGSPIMDEDELVIKIKRDVILYRR